MIDFVNDRDRLIQATSPRYSVNMSEKRVFLTLSTPVFATNNAGTVASPTAITATVELENIVGPVTFTVTAGSTISVSGNVATLQFSNMGSNTVFIQAKAVDTETGVEFLRSAVISKVFDGGQGVPGTSAPTLYTWVKYGDSSTGAGLSDNPTGKSFIGLAYNKPTAVESTTPTDYEWALIKGTDGIPGVPGADGLTTYTWLKYSDFPDGTALYDIPTATTMYIGLAVNKTTSSESTNKADYSWSKFKGDQGVPGTTGQRGTKILAASGYTTWTDASAVAELAAAGFGAPIDRDTVTLYSLTFSMTKYYQGGSWYVLGTYIDGNLLVQGSIATQALAVESVTAAKIDARGLSLKDSAGNVILSAGTPLTANYMNAGIGAGNLISNSAPAPPVDGVGGLGVFALDYTFSPGTTVFGPGYAPYIPNGAGGVYVRCGGVVPANTIAAIVGVRQGAANRKFPVTAGVRYEFSVYVGAHRCRGTVNVAFYDSNGTYVSESAGTVVENGQPTGAMVNFPRSVLFVAAPTGAAYAALRGVMTGNGGTDAYLFLSMWYFGVALSAQTVPSAWADGPGATLGDNVFGQITPSTSPTYIANAAILNAQIGGDIYSSNWNGSNVGWYLDRNGNFYANNGIFRGSLSGVTGSFLLIRSPNRLATGSGSGYDLSDRGFLFYNAANTLKLKMGDT